MDTSVQPAVRHVDRITTKVDHGPTAQADSMTAISLGIGGGERLV
jgi:hypothetical protein